MTMIGSFFMFTLKTFDGQIYINKLESGSYELSFDIPATLEKLSEISESIGKLNNRSFMEGSRNLSGLLGEYLFFQIFRNKVDYVGNSVYDYDFVNRKTGKTYDVKTKTQGVDVDPIIGKSEPFDASVPLYSQKMNCDDYVFFRIHKDMKKAWMLGWIEKYFYFNNENVKILKAGKTDGWNKMQVKCNSANLKYKYLNFFNLSDKHFLKINSNSGIEESDSFLKILENAN